MDSKLAHGTTIDVYLPTTEATGVPAAQPARARAPSKGLVLVVDDEATMRAGAARIVEHLGLTATSASDGDEAITVFEQLADDVALVVLDMVMPRMSGTATFHAIRRVRPAMPILLVSGYTDHAAAQELLAAGADGFLEKPYTAEQLGAELDRILGRRRTTTPSRRVMSS